MHRSRITTHGHLQVRISKAGDFDLREIVNLEICRIASRFNPDDLLFNGRPEVRAKPLSGDQVHAATKEVLKVVCQLHEIPERGLPRRELDQNIHVAVRPVLSPDRGPKIPIFATPNRFRIYGSTYSSLPITDRFPTGGF